MGRILFVRIVYRWATVDVVFKWMEYTVLQTRFTAGQSNKCNKSGTRIFRVSKFYQQSCVFDSTTLLKHFTPILMTTWNESHPYFLNSFSIAFLCILSHSSVFLVVLVYIDCKNVFCVSFVNIDAAFWNSISRMVWIIWDR